MFISSNYLTSSGLKITLRSKHASIYYLEKCRVQVDGGWVGYVTSESKKSYYWNIPIANTTTLMLRIGTSVTQTVMCEFAHAGVTVGFRGMDGTPLYSANEMDVDVSRLSPQSKYRPIGYFQQWVFFQFVEDKRLTTTKRFQLIHLTHIDERWSSPKMLREHALQPDVNALHALLNRTYEEIDTAENHTQLMFVEAKSTKALYKMIGQTVGHGNFTRAKRGDGIDMTSRFFDQGNCLAYGLVAVTAWVIGILHGLAIMYDKTCRSGLIFDLVDLIKDALVMSQTFITAMAGEDAQEFRQRCVGIFQQADALDIMIASLQEAAQALTKTDQ